MMEMSGVKWPGFGALADAQTCRGQHRRTAAGRRLNQAAPRHALSMRAAAAALGGARCRQSRTALARSHTTAGAGHASIASAYTVGQPHPVGPAAQTAGAGRAQPRRKPIARHPAEVKTNRSPAPNSPFQAPDYLFSASTMEIDGAPCTEEVGAARALEPATTGTGGSHHHHGYIERGVFVLTL